MLQKQPCSEIKGAEQYQTETKSNESSQIVRSQPQNWKQKLNLLKNSEVETDDVFEFQE